MGRSAKSSVKNKVMLEKEVIDQGLEYMSYSKLFTCLFVIGLASLCGFLNSYHEYTMFENDRHFSHLSALEREMTFRTEMGLYFSFYKTMVEAPSYIDGVTQLLSCNLTEYPNTINIIRKYNVFPEIILGLEFRIFRTITEYFKIKTKECWMVDRGEEFDEVESCEGIGDYHYFYVIGVFSWNSLVSSLIFLYGYVLSDSILGGLIAVSSFFFNHGEATRVQWTPPLRESFGYPFCLAGMLLVSLSLKYPNYGKHWRYLIALSSVGFLTTWQIAQFPLLIQAMAAFGLYFMGFSDVSQLQVVLEGQILGLLGGFILLFANHLLLSSFYTPFLLIAFILCKFDKFIIKESNLFFIKVFQLFSLLGGTILLKLAIATIFSFKDDNHIWDLICSKFTNFKDFHTMLYTCAVEFNFLSEENVTSLVRTLLIPISIFVVFTTIFRIFYDLWANKFNGNQYSQIVFVVLQTSAFSIMAILFMRLKVFFTPNMCILASLLLSKKLFSFLNKNIFRMAAVFLILSLMSINGIKNLKNQREIMGEYSNPGLEELLLWVNSSTPLDAVFAGPMPTMANLMLSTRRPIVNNPFYEDSEMRERTLKVYSLYSRKEPEQVYKTLKSMGVNYAVIVRPYCYNSNKAGCAMIDLWDVQDHANVRKNKLCQRLMTNPWPFTFVFRNDEYAILGV